jgi:putative nucleotidyltransferase with HDIG domain
VTHLSSEACSRGSEPAPGAAAPAHTSVRIFREFSQTLIDALAATLEARDGSTRDHAERVQRLAVALAIEHAIGDRQLLEAIHAAALLHDIGKLAIPDSILLKPGPLTPGEYETVKQHAVIGAQILAPLSGCGSLALIVRHHHENWNGTGYPDGLRGERIPVGARVLAVADCYDALTSDRPYRRELSHETALDMIRERRGTMYDPQIVDEFMRMMGAWRNAAQGSLPFDAAAVPQHRAGPASRWAAARML